MKQAKYGRFPKGAERPVDVRFARLALKWKCRAVQIKGEERDSRTAGQIAELQLANAFDINDFENVWPAVFIDCRVFVNLFVLLKGFAPFHGER